MMTIFFKEYSLLLRQFLRLDLKSAERMITPFFFGCLIILNFAFAFGSVAEIDPNRFVIACSSLGVLFAVQVAMGRLFEAESRDRAFDIMRAKIKSPLAWFFSKLSATLLIAIIMMVPLFCLIMIMFPCRPADFLHWSFAAIFLLSLTGLSCLGLLLAAISLRSESQALIFPFLFYPLCVPVLFAQVYAQVAFLDKAMETRNNWLYLLLIFVVIYLTLSAILFAEFVDPHAQDAK